MTARQIAFALRSANAERAKTGPRGLFRIVDLGHIPKTVPAFFTAVPVRISGLEVEGQAATLIASPTQDAQTILVLGPKIPVVGDDLLARQVDGYWVARRAQKASKGSYGKVTIPNCVCQTPTSISMVSKDPACNFGMFQSCTITYGAAPPEMAGFGITGDIFTSQENFIDPITKSRFYYYLECFYNQYFLTRIFPKSPFGSPYRDGILYAWVIGNQGCTCDPFKLPKGSAFPGSDATCSVSLLGN